jgi:D-sedoheptulose 7-phosphate isomerase
MTDKPEFTAKEIYAELLERFPALCSCGDEILVAFEMIGDSFRSGGKLLTAGNGGSAADAEHIVGELMKSFNFRRPVDRVFAEEMALAFGEQGKKLAGALEGALPAVSLPSLMSLSTAYSNDAEPQAVFAQMVYGLGKPGDVLFAISTSGNSPNIVFACMAARALGMKIIGLSPGRRAEK